MALTEAQLSARIDALTEAIAQGYMSVRYEDRSVTYRSLHDMHQTRQWLQEELAKLSGQPVNRSKQIRMGVRDGY